MKLYNIPIQKWRKIQELVFGKMNYQPWHSRVTGEPGPFHQFHYRETRHFISCLPNRMGKDYSTAAEAATLLLCPGKSIAFVGAVLSFSIITFEHLLRFIIPVLIRENIPYSLRMGTKPSLVLWPGTKDQSSVRCESFKNVGNIEGKSFDLIVICEASDPYTSFQWIRENMPTRLMDYEGSFIMQSTNTARNPQFKEFILDNINRKDCIYVGKLGSIDQFTAYDSPYISLKEIEENKSRMLPTTWAEKFLGEFVTMSGLVIKSFNPSRHILESIPQAVSETYAAIDFGANDLTAILVGTKIGNRWYIRKEYTTTQEPISSIIPYLKKMVHEFKIRTIYCDHQKQLYLELQKAGLPAVAATKNPVFESVVALDTKFFNDEIYILKNECPNLLREFQFYSWSQKNNVPIDSYNHSIDALRYLTDSSSYKIQMPKVNEYINVPRRPLAGF